MSYKLGAAATASAAIPGRRAAETGRIGDRQWVGVVSALLAVYLIWGSTYLGIRVALEGFPPMLMGSIRFLLAGAVLFALLRLRGAPIPSRAEWRGAAIVGALLLVGGNGGVMFAEQWVSSGLAALGAGASPVWAAIFAGLLGRWPNRREWLGLAVGFCGLLVLNLEGSVRASPVGAAVLFAAPMCWALGSVLSTRLTLPPAMMNSAAQMLIGGALFLPLGLLRGERIHALPGPHPLLAMIYLIVCALIAFSAYSYLLRKVRPALATSYAYVNPVVAVLLGVTLAGEHIHSADLIAMPVILSGVVLVMLGRERH